ncbi:MAG: glycoside hydrolase family 3 N-terminal domain-containing protein [Lachnospiraceae bacterium]
MRQRLSLKQGLCMAFISIFLFTGLCGCTNIGSDGEVSGREKMAGSTANDTQAGNITGEDVAGAETDPDSGNAEEAAAVQENADEYRTEDTEEQMTAKIKQMVADLSLEEKIGQLLLVDFRRWETAEASEASDLEEMNNEVASIIQEYHIGNIILFGENLRDTKKATELVYAMQEVAISSGNLPLLIGTDQEGGSVTRLGQGTCMPGNMAIGSTNNPEYAYENGNIIGSELAAIGINCNFAPDADVNDNPDNPIINLRSFGDDPKKVAVMGNRMSDGLKNAGVIACVKHFPGHGNTSTDTHTGLAIVEKTSGEWEACEKLPFAAAIDNGIDMIMTAHIQYPQLDHTQINSKLDGKPIYLPATLSHQIITGVLRRELGYDGVVVTDALDMQAISDHFGESEAVIMALNAGADLMCNPTTMRKEKDREKLTAIYAAIENAVENGTLSMERINEAAYRVLLLKQKYGILDTEQYKRPVETRVEKAVSVVGSAEHRAAERKIAKDAVQLVYSGSYTPFQPQKEDTVLVLMPYESELYSTEYAINRLRKEGLLGAFNVELISYTKNPAPNAKAQEKIKTADYIILGSEVYASTKNDAAHWMNTAPQSAADLITAAGKQSVTAVLSMGLPYGTDRYAGFPCFISYSYAGMSKEDAKSGVITGKYIPNIPAAIEKIFGSVLP